MQTTGILSILPRIEAGSVPSFDRLYKLTGQNTGNLLFTNAVWNQIGGLKERINFTFDPGRLNEKLDALVIPAANWLSPHVDFSHLADLVEQLKIPVVLIGLGAQDADYSGAVNIPDGTVRFVRAVAERSASVSVRGEYTRKILSGLGVNNVTVTGCPSLYHDFQSFVPPSSRLNIRLGRGLIHATRYSAGYEPFAHTDSVQRRLFRFAYANKLDILFQSEPEEMQMLTGAQHDTSMDERLKGLLLEIYGAADWQSLCNYLKTQGRLFFDVDEWSHALDRYDYVLGTRLHGTIMALNSGVPAILIYHDSRTREMAEFAAIPSASVQRTRLDERKITSMFRGADWAQYYQRRTGNKAIYKDFLRENGIFATDF